MLLASVSKEELEEIEREVRGKMGADDKTTTNVCLIRVQVRRHKWCGNTRTILGIGKGLLRWNSCKRGERHR